VYSTSTLSADAVLPKLLAPYRYNTVWRAERCIHHLGYRCRVPASKRNELVPGPFEVQIRRLLESMFASQGIDVSSCLEHLSIMQSGEAIARLVEGRATVVVPSLPGSAGVTLRSTVPWGVESNFVQYCGHQKWAVPPSLGGEAWAGGPGCGKEG
jgi:hypothetical protein